MPELVADHINSAGERISIERVTDGEHAGAHLLIIWDDPPSLGGSGLPAPMKLDAGTRDWLAAQLSDHGNHDHEEDR